MTEHNQKKNNSIITSTHSADFTVDIFLNFFQTVLHSELPSDTGAHKTPRRGLSFIFKLQ